MPSFVRAFQEHGKRVDNIVSALTEGEEATAIELGKKVGYAAKK